MIEDTSEQLLRKRLGHPQATSQIFGGDVMLTFTSPDEEFVPMAYGIVSRLVDNVIVGEIVRQPNGKYLPVCLVGSHNLPQDANPSEAAWLLVECANDHQGKQHQIIRLGSDITVENRLGVRPIGLPPIESGDM